MKICFAERRKLLKLLKTILKALNLVATGNFAKSSAAPLAKAPEATAVDSWEDPSVDLSLDASESTDLDSPAVDERCDVVDCAEIEFLQSSKAKENFKSLMVKSHGGGRLVRPYVRTPKPADVFASLLQEVISQQKKSAEKTIWPNSGLSGGSDGTGRVGKGKAAGVLVLLLKRCG